MIRLNTILLILLYCPFLPAMEKLSEQEKNKLIEVMASHFFNGKPDVVSILLKLGANPNMHQNCKCNPGNGDMSNCLQETPLLIAAQNGNAQMVKVLLEGNANPNVRDKVTKETPLMKACRASLLHSPFVRRRNTTSCQRTNLILASYCTIITCLLAHKADRHLTNITGKTALQIVANEIEEPHVRRTIVARLM